MIYFKCTAWLAALLLIAGSCGCRPETTQALSAQESSTAKHAEADDDKDEADEDHPGDKDARHPGDKEEKEGETADARNPLLIKLEEEAREQLGLEVATVEAATLAPVLTAYGVVEADPSRTFTVRAPVAGYLRVTDGKWPGLGMTVKDDAVLGTVEPRLGPLDQMTLVTQRVEAEGTVAEIQAEFDAAKASYEGKKSLNADGKMVSDRSLEEAEAKVRSSEARLLAARRKLDLLEKQQSAAARGLAPVAVHVDRGGEVIEAAATPGEVVESGQALLRVAQFDSLLIRIELPMGESWHPGREAPRIWPVGGEDQVAEATVVGLSPQAGTRTSGQCWLMRIAAGESTLRPGASIVAHLPANAEPIRGVRIPTQAIVRYAGRAWVFVRVSDEEFERRDVTLTSPAPQGWFSTEGVNVGDAIVVTGAQMLLSEQLKAQIEAEEEASE